MKRQRQPSGTGLLTGAGHGEPVDTTPYGISKHGVRTLDDVLFSLRLDSKRLRRYKQVAEARKGTKHEAAAQRDVEISRSVLDRLLVEFKSLGGLKAAS